MILKAKQRGGARKLATHLLNSYDNIRVEVVELRGSIANDLHGAFEEWEAEARSTKCTKFLYSLSASPDEGQGRLTREQYIEFFDRAEKSIGLAGQPRAIVIHEKPDEQGVLREHAHCVWSRIDTEHARSITVSHDFPKLWRAAQEFARDHGLTLPEGMRENSRDSRIRNKDKNVTFAEKQQEERTGVHKADRAAAVTDAWRRSVDARTFIAELEKENYFLARGDQRGYVVIDLAGEIHSLSRQLHGVRAKEVKDKLAELPPGLLPGVEEAKEHAREVRAALQQEKERRQTPRFDQMQERRVERAAIDEDRRRTEDRRNSLTQRRADLAARHEQRRRPVEDARTALIQRHATERDALRDLHRAADQGVIAARAARQPKGLTAFLARITGIQLIAAAGHRRQDREREAAQGHQQAALSRRHDSERHEIERQRRAIDALEKRERQSLETRIRREEFHRVATPAREQNNERDTTGRDRAGRELPPVADHFRSAAPPPKDKEPQKTGGGLAAWFNRLAAAIAGRDSETAGGPARQPPTEPPPPARPAPEQPGSLADAFRERAAQKEEQEKERDAGGGDRGRSRGPARRDPGKNRGR